MTPDDLIRIRHMLDAIVEALSFASGKNRIDLDDNRMMALAIIKEIEIIGEAASKLSQTFKASQPFTTNLKFVIGWTGLPQERGL